MGQVRTRKRGKTYSYIFEAGNVDGKRKVVEKGGFATQKEAYNAGVAAYTDWTHGNIGITSVKITLNDFMTNWLENVVALNVKESSLQKYKAQFKEYIEPYLGEEKVQGLNPAKIDKFMRDLTAKGLAYNTLTAVHSLLSQALTYAVYPAQIISSNPAHFIKVSKKAPKNVVKRTIITREKFNELLAKYPFGSSMYIPLLLLYHTGMRVGEVCGLTWQNIDFERNVIMLDSQITYISEKGLCVTSPKTQSSIREIFMDKILVEELSRWKKQQELNEQEVGGKYVYIYRGNDDKVLQQSKALPLNLERITSVCTLKNGRIIQSRYLSATLKKEKLNAHSFRHTHATVLIENGATPKGVAGRLGHSNAVITQNLYTHNTEKLQGDTMTIFENLMQTNS